MSEHLFDGYLKLAEAPGLTHPGYPICDACDVETEPGDMEWVCPSCGTVWPGDNLEADASEAQMFEEWSGETLIGQVCPNDLAWRVSHLRDPSEREKYLSEQLKERTMTDSMRDRIERELGKDRLHELDKPVFGGRQLSDKQIEGIADALLAAFPWLAYEPRCCEHDKCPGGSLCCCQGTSDAEAEDGARALRDRIEEQDAELAAFRAAFGGEQDAK